MDTLVFFSVQQPKDNFSLTMIILCSTSVYPRVCFCVPDSGIINFTINALT